MKICKILLSLTLVLCVLAVPFAASAAATPVDLMPASKDDFTIVSGSGEITVTDGVAVIKNTGSDTLRVTLNSTTTFDISTLHTLHMNFKAETPFKMAYQIGSGANDNGWLNTSDNFAGMYTISADRAAAGDFDVNMPTSEITSLTEKSAVSFLQFIILVDAGGTFTINTVEMTDGTNAVGGGETTKAESATTTTAAATTTTVVKTTAKPGNDSAKTADVSNALLFVAVAALAGGVVTITAVTAKKASH